MNEPVAVVDDDPAVREAYARAIESVGRKCVSFSAVNDAVDAARRKTLPRLVLCDLHFDLHSTSPQSIVNTFAAITTILHHQPSTVVIMLTGRDPSGEHVFEALRAGAVGYVDKADPRLLGGGLAALLLDAEGGGSPISPRIARRVIDAFKPTPAAEGERLTPREIELLTHFRGGHTYEDCAKAMEVSINTVRAFVREIYRKLQVASKTEAVTRAMQLGLIPGGTLA